MRIDAGTNYLHASRRPPASDSDRATAASFSAVMTATQGDSTKQVDFTSMTRSEMRDWLSPQIRSGEMSLDDSRPFMLMTMKMPVNGSHELAVENDATRYDFMQMARDGIQGAEDKTTLKMLESAMSIMLRQQGQPIGINTSA